MSLHVYFSGTPFPTGLRGYESVEDHSVDESVEDREIVEDREKAKEV